MQGCWEMDSACAAVEDSDSPIACDGWTVDDDPEELDRSARAPDPFRVYSLAQLDDSRFERRRRALCEGESCVCHVRESETGNLTYFSESSWPTFVKAARVRRDDMWDALLAEGLDEDSEPRGGYHRRCYQSYTHKKALRRVPFEVGAAATVLTSYHGFVGFDKEDVDAVATSSADRPVTRSMTERTNIKACLFCQSKYWKRRKGMRREPLSVCETFEAAAAIFEAANIRVGQTSERILMELESGPDPIAAEVCYHRSCYADFTDQRKLYAMQEEALAAENVCSDNDHENLGPFEKAFDVLQREVHADVLLEPERGQVVRMSELRKRYVALLKEEGIDAEGYHSSRLKFRLQKHFGDRITFVRTGITEPEVLAPSSIPGHVLLGAACASMTNKASPDSLSEPEDDLSLQDMAPPLKMTDVGEDQQACRELFNSAMFLRSVILEMADTLPEVPRAGDLTDAAVNAPVPLYNFLVWLLSGTSRGSLGISAVRRAETSQVVHQHALSILQDLVYCTTNGRLRTCKHLALPVAVRHLTRSTQVVSLLNRYGHGCSASKLAEYETALAEDIMKDSSVEGYLPTNISTASPVVFCWDNNDLAEETLSGAGTTHCTNGILIQHQQGGSSQASCIRSAAHSDCPERERKKRPKRHSIALPPPPELEYNAGLRCDPPPARISADLWTSATLAQQEAVNLDLVWLLLRMSQKHSELGRPEGSPQCVPAWTAFNAEVRAKTQPMCSTVGYLPIIPDSPTKLATIHELLVRSCEIAARLDQQPVIITLDQAIYSKAQEIVWKNPVPFRNVVLRLGGFHIAGAFLGVLGKRFGKAGLQDLFIESGVVGSSAIEAVLSGKHYNRAIRAHKLLYEAMMRLKLEQFESTLAVDQDDEFVQAAKL